MDLLLSFLLAYKNACKPDSHGYHCNYQKLAVAYNHIANLLNHDQQAFDGYSRNCPRNPDMESCRFYRDAVDIYHHNTKSDNFPPKYPLTTATQLHQLYKARDE